MTAEAFAEGPLPPVAPEPFKSLLSAAPQPAATRGVSASALRRLLPMRLLWLLGFLLAACGGPAVYTQHRPMRLDDEVPVVPEVSLIPGDAVVLSDAEIARILDAEARLPRAPRLALVHLRHDSPDASVDSRSLPRDVGPQLVQQLRYSRLFADASYLPGFLHARAPTMGQLREAAARYQAELIFVFSTDCALSHELGFLSDDQARARCHADAALVDVRTGLVPFGSRAERTVTLRTADDEFTLDETLRRAETRGVDAAMRANAEALVRFLSGWKPAGSTGPGAGAEVRRPAEAVEAPDGDGSGAFSSESNVR